MIAVEEIKLGVLNPSAEMISQKCFRFSLQPIAKKISRYLYFFRSLRDAGKGKTFIPIIVSHFLNSPNSNKFRISWFFCENNKDRTTRLCPPVPRTRAFLFMLCFGGLST